MAGNAAPNLPSFCLNATAQAARNAEYTDTPFTDTDGDGTLAGPYLGGNRAGSNAPGIGINTGDIVLTAAEVAAGVERFGSWTELDQHGAARIPQDSQHLAGDAFVDRDTGTSVPPDSSGGTEGLTTETVVTAIDDTEGATDFNDSMNLVITDAAVADGGVMDTVSGAINQSGKTSAIGDLQWGTVPVI